MPWRWAISNNSTMAHSTTSGLGSAGCRILFIGHLHKNHAVLVKAKRYIHQIFCEIVCAVCSRLHTFPICRFWPDASLSDEPIIRKVWVLHAWPSRKRSNNSSAEGDIGQAGDRNGNEHVRPQCESAFQPRY